MKLIDVKHVPSKDQVADVFTKSATSAKFPFLRNKLLGTLSLRGNIRNLLV